MYNFIFLYYGFSSLLMQLVAFRELLVLFYGNEIFMGTFLSSWLFWVGLGSLLARRLLKKEGPSAVHFSYGFLALSLLFPAMILLIRASRGAFAFGEFIGPVATVFYTFGAMSVLCLIIGGQFSLACAVAPRRGRADAVLGRVYMYETLGAVIGGVVFTYLLIGAVPTFIMALALSLGYLLVSFLLFINNRSLRNIILIVAALAALFMYFKIEPSVNRIEWRRYEWIGQKETRSATLSLVKMGSIKNVFVNGMLSASFPDPESYEQAAHWPLLVSAEVNRILVLGDTSLGLLKEALKHKPGHIDYVVPDRTFLDLVGPYLDSADASALKDPAIQLHYADARAFIRRSKNKYDAVIINIPEVPNLKANRFYTKEFFAQVRSILRPNGVLALSVVSSENYLSAQTRMFNASVYLTLKSVFKEVEAIRGDTITFFAGSSVINMQEAAILGRFNSRNISNRYIVPAYIEYKLRDKRRAELIMLLKETVGVQINRDFRPTTCYYFTGLWLNKLASPSGYLLLALVFIAAAFALFRKQRPLFFSVPRRELVFMFTLGFTSLSLELILLLGYQIIAGDVYWQMGVLFASFMLGLFLGSFLGNQLKDSLPRRYFLCLTCLSLMMTGLLVGTAVFLPRFIALSSAANLFTFISLLAVIGMIVGAAFVTAGFLMSGTEVIGKAGRLYAADLWGSSLGAVLSTNLIVLFFGILGALYFFAAISLIGLALFFILSRKANGCSRT